MTETEAIGIAVIMTVIAIILFVVERIRWVRSARLRLVEKDFSELFVLPSGWHMFWRFWIWKVDKFLY